MEGPGTVDRVEAGSGAYPAHPRPASRRPLVAKRPERGGEAAKAA